MNLRHNPRVGRGVIKFTFRPAEQAVKTTIFARRVNEYISVDDTESFEGHDGLIFSYADIISMLLNAKARGEFNEEYVKNLYRRLWGCDPIDITDNVSPEPARLSTAHARNITATAVSGTFEVPNSTARTTTSSRRRRRLQRDGYHANGSGTFRTGVSEAISRVAVDEDGVRRTFGVEYEIYTLTSDQESDLCYVLDDLPPCHVEHDGSLGDNGVELVFQPVGAEDYIRIVKTLREFIDNHGIYMCDGSGNGAGMHTTYGVSNSEVRSDDYLSVNGSRVPKIQARLNRISAMLKFTATKQQIKDIFGRYFVGYAAPSSASGDNYLSCNHHANSMSINGRAPVNGVYGCWEFRLLNYKCNPEKVVEFFKASEWVFHRTMYASDAAAMLRCVMPTGAEE